MRALAFALIVAAGACSAVDDYSRFHFSTDGGVVLGDGGSGSGDGGASSDLAMPPPPTYGQPCDADCAAPYSCFHLGSKDTTGICSRSCSPSNLGACAGIDASCVTVEQITLCMPNCDPALNKACRSDLSCCANMKVTTTVGVCAPAATDFCGKG